MSEPQNPPDRSRKTLSLLAILFVFSALFSFRQPQFPARGVGFRVTPDPAQRSLQPVYETASISQNKVPEVHSPTLVPLNGGRVGAFWYGGEDEGAEDTAIYTATFDPFTSKWSDEAPVVGREFTALSVQRYIKKLGNAVALRDDKGRLWLFYVTSMWGWSGSAINFTRSEDEGLTWHAPRRLITGPFLNHSTLVRGAPFLFADGTIGIPVYHEFIAKFCELVRLDQNGNILHKQRLSDGRTSLQPAITPITAQHAICTMRPAGTSPKQLLRSETHDGGLTWTEMEPASIHSDYSGSAPIGMENDDILAVTRDELQLLFFVSHDGGRDWEKSFVIDHTDAVKRHLRKQGPSYPFLLQTHSGDYHLVYSLERREIRHARFNQAWIDQQTKKSPLPASGEGPGVGQKPAVESRSDLVPGSSKPTEAPKP